jgi:hypothetical protein
MSEMSAQETMETVGRFEALAKQLEGTCSSTYGYTILITGCSRYVVMMMVKIWPRGDARVHMYANDCMICMNRYMRT